MPPKDETKKELSPEVKAARRQAALRLRMEEKAEEINVRMVRKRAEDPEDPSVTPEMAERQEKALKDLKAKRAAADKVSGLTAGELAEIEGQAAVQQEQNTAQQVEQWKAQRAIHQDMLDNPEVYGGVDLGGAPIDPEQQRAHIKAFDAAIAAATTKN